jgi:DNA adenine methylase
LGYHFAFLFDKRIFIFYGRCGGHCCSSAFLREYAGRGGGLNNGHRSNITFDFSWNSIFAVGNGDRWAVGVKMEEIRPWSDITRPALSYPGGKFRIAPWIISHFPDHDTYNEPFCGAASVLLRKSRSQMETINDASGELVNFLITLRDRPEELIDAIKKTYWAKSEWELAQKPAADNLEAARRFYVLMWQSIKPLDPSARAWKRQKKLSRGRSGKSSPMRPAARSFAEVDHIMAIADRLHGVAIERMDALEFIKMYDYEKALFYVDPPYLASTRKSAKHYEKEMTADDQHADLGEVLNGCSGMIALSHYACDLYRELYEERGWKRYEKSSRTFGPSSRKESLYLNPAAQRKNKENSGTLFNVLLYNK